MADRRRVTSINPIFKQSTRFGQSRNLTSRPNRYDRNFGRRCSAKTSNSTTGAESNAKTEVPSYKIISKQILYLLKIGKVDKGQPLTENDLRKACIDLLEKCDKTDPVVLEIDESGYDTVQHVVGKGDTELLKYILSRGFDIAINKRKCSSLLHIACSKSLDDMIQLLLDNGANLSHRASKCFPYVKHYILNRRSSDNPCDYRHVGCCREERRELLTPLHTAVESDNLPVLKALLNHPKVNANKLSELRILEFACLKGTVRSLPFLIQTFPFEVNTIDTVRRTLVWTSFKSSEACGMTFVKEAMKYGLDKKLLNEKSDCFCNSTVLHYIFWLETCIHFMDILNLIIEAGFETSNLPIADSDGVNLLHMIMLQMGKRVPSIMINQAVMNTNNSNQQSFEDLVYDLEQEKEKHIFASVEFLIQNGVDKDALATNGEGIVHKLLHNCVYLNFSGFTNFRKTLPQIIRVLEYLLRFGLDLSVNAEYVSTPLNYVVHTISSFHAEQLDTIWPDLWYLFTILLKYGSDPNASDRRGVSNVSILLTTLHRWLSYTINNDSDGPKMTKERDLPLRTLIRVHDMMDLFVRHGLNPRHDILELCCKQIAILCNISSADQEFLEEIKNLFKPFFLNGVNPNTLRMITESNSEYGVPCQLHAQFYLARGFIIHVDTDAMQQFFSIFTNTLSRENYNSLLLALCTILLENFDKASYQDISSLCIDEIMRLKQIVRPLKCLTRIVIANALSWEIEKKKSFLPIPKLLQEYLAQL